MDDKKEFERETDRVLKIVSGEAQQMPDVEVNINCFEKEDKPRFPMWRKIGLFCAGMVTTGAMTAFSYVESNIAAVVVFILLTLALTCALYEIVPEKMN